jgi:D-hexose-6-phosphate mutarotase
MVIWIIHDFGSCKMKELDEMPDHEWNAMIKLETQDFEKQLKSLLKISNDSEEEE